MLYLLNSIDKDKVLKRLKELDSVRRSFVGGDPELIELFTEFNNVLIYKHIRQHVMTEFKDQFQDNHLGPQPDNHNCEFDHTFMADEQLIDILFESIHDKTIVSVRVIPVRMMTNKTTYHTNLHLPAILVETVDE